MNYSNRKWIIVNMIDITEIMIANSIQSNAQSLKKSLDNSKAMLKWDGETPECFDGIAVYNHSEILEILNTSDWKED